MIPTRFALAVCLLVPSLAARSQTTDQSTSAKVGATEFRAISTGKLATFEKELSELAGQGFRLERLLESFTIFYQAALLSRQQTEGGAAKYEYGGLGRHIGSVIVLGQSTLGRRYSAARVSRRQSHWSAAQPLARGTATILRGSI